MTVLGRLRELARSLLLIVIAGGAAGAGLALQTEELVKFAPVPSSVAYMIALLAGVSVGVLATGMRQGLLIGLSVTMLGTIVLFLAIYLPNIEIAAAAPELLLRSLWWGAMVLFVLTLMGVFLGRIVSGE